jgi:hypothetical protein
LPLARDLQLSVEPAAALVSDSMGLHALLGITLVLRSTVSLLTTTTQSINPSFLPFTEKEGRAARGPGKHPF